MALTSTDVVDKFVGTTWMPEAEFEKFPFRNDYEGDFVFGQGYRDNSHPTMLFYWDVSYNVDRTALVVGWRPSTVKFDFKS